MRKITICITSRFKAAPMSWFEANKFCKNIGAKLVEINSEEENAAIVDEINKRKFQENKMYFWIGLTDLRKEGVWKLE